METGSDGFSWAPPPVKRSSDDLVPDDELFVLPADEEEALLLFFLELLDFAFLVFLMGPKMGSGLGLRSSSCDASLSESSAALL